jgi:hypothetical protein
MIAKCETARNRGVEAPVHRNVSIHAFYRANFESVVEKYGGRVVAGKYGGRSVVGDRWRERGKIWRESGGGKRMGEKC